MLPQTGECKRNFIFMLWFSIDLLNTRLLSVRCTDYIEYYMYSLISYSKKLEIKNLRKYR
jgi:hypothetical protein